MGKKKICFIVNSLGGGGAERMITVLANGLYKDFDIHIVLLHNPVEYTLRPGQKIYVICKSDKCSALMQFLRLPKLAYKYHRYCKENDIALSVSFLSKSSYVSIMAKLFFGSKFKTIVCERTHQVSWLKNFSKMKRMMSVFLLKNLYNKADLIIANSRQIQKDLVQHFKLTPPIRVIYNGIDNGEINLMSHEKNGLQFSKDYFHFISVGRFQVEKNQKLLIDAFSKISHLKIKLLLVGKGELEGPLKEQVKEHNLNNQVTFVPYQANPFKYISQSGCFVLSSKVEGLPNIVLEAMSCSTPVVSTDCLTGPREILAPLSNPSHRLEAGYEVCPYGILCAEGDAFSLSKAMNRMYEDRELRDELKMASKSRALEFEAPIILEQYKKVFEEI
ncbi:MAG: glycosyltransferase [Ferruginibacter sp.]